MTSLLPSPARADSASARVSAGDLRRDLQIRRPLALTAPMAGILSAGGPLLVCMALGLAGWFMSDAGAHGAPRDGLRIGALAWLMAHGSGVMVHGVAITVMPLGITLICAWTTWRVGHRLGDAVSGHGPDAARIADGERDWTVLSAGLLFTVGYVATAVATGRLASGPLGGAPTEPNLTRVVLWSLVLCGVLAVPAIAVGSGRAAIWTATLPAVVVAGAATARRVLRLWLLVATLAFLVALVSDFNTALNVVSQLHTGTEASILVVVVCLLVIPNATLFSGSYLLGPGFTVGTHTLVSPAVVSIGALPMFPLLAALPDTGPTPAWTAALIGVPPVVAAVAAARSQRHHPTLRYEEGALHGGVGGVVAGVGFALLATLAGGAVGPGRMSEVGPLAFAVLVHAITSFGIGGILGGLAMTWWQRRGAEPVEPAPSSDAQVPSTTPAKGAFASLDENGDGDGEATQSGSDS